MTRRLRVVITGGAGFVGHHLGWTLHAMGHEVRSIDDLRQQPLMSLVGELTVANCVDAQSSDLQGVDVVYHLASDKSVPGSFDRPVEYLENVDAGRAILSAAIEARVPRVFVASTCEVYGNTRKPPNIETDSLRPESPYACSKVGLEMVARAFQASATATDITILRLFNVFGPGERPDAVVPRFCAQAVAGSPLSIEGEGTQRRDLSFVDDTIDRMVGLLGPTTLPPQLNIGSGTSVSINWVASQINRIAGRSADHIVREPPRRNEISQFVSDTGLLRQVLNMSDPQSHHLLLGLSATYRWWADSVGFPTSSDAATKVTASG